MHARPSKEMLFADALSLIEKSKESLGLNSESQEDFRRISVLGQGFD